MGGWAISQKQDSSREMAEKIMQGEPWVKKV